MTKRFEKKGNKQMSGGDLMKNWPWALTYIYIYVYISIYIYTHTHTHLFSCFQKYCNLKKIYEMCMNKRFTYFMYILKFQCFLKTDVYIQYIFFKYHVGITCSSRCKPRNFHLNKLVIDYNQYLSTYLKQGKSAISWSSNSYKNIRKSIKINMNIHSIEGHEDQ